MISDVSAYLKELLFGTAARGRTHCGGSRSGSVGALLTSSASFSESDLDLDGGEETGELGEDSDSEVEEIEVAVVSPSSLVVCSDLRWWWWLRGRRCLRCL